MGLAGVEGVDEGEAGAADEEEDEAHEEGEAALGAAEHFVEAFFGALGAFEEELSGFVHGDHGLIEAGDGLGHVAGVFLAGVELFVHEAEQFGVLAGVFGELADAVGGFGDVLEEGFLGEDLLVHVFAEGADEGEDFAGAGFHGGDLFFAARGGAHLFPEGVLGRVDLLHRGGGEFEGAVFEVGFEGDFDVLGRFGGGPGSRLRGRGRRGFGGGDRFFFAFGFFGGGFGVFEFGFFQVHGRSSAWIKGFGCIHIGKWGMRKHQASITLRRRGLIPFKPPGEFTHASPAI